MTDTQTYEETGRQTQPNSNRLELQGEKGVTDIQTYRYTNKGQIYIWIALRYGTVGSPKVVELNILSFLLLLYGGWGAF